MVLERLLTQIFVEVRRYRLRSLRPADGSQFDHCRLLLEAMVLAQMVGRVVLASWMCKWTPQEVQADSKATTSAFSCAGHTSSRCVMILVS